MKKFVIERLLPGIGSKSPDEMADAAACSNRALADVGPGIQWQHSYVCGDRTFCIYLAENEELIRRHAEFSGFPADRIVEVVSMLEPTSARAPQRR